MFDLMAFCDDDKPSVRPYLTTPFSMGEHTYATNGHIMVRIPRREGISELDAKLGISKSQFDAPLSKLSETTFSPLRHDPLPPVPAPADENCDECNGTGHEHECPNCRCECWNCDGVGSTKKEWRISTTIRGAHLDLKYVILMLSLPNVTVAERDFHGQGDSGPRRKSF